MDVAAPPRERLGTPTRWIAMLLASPQILTVHKFPVIFMVSWFVGVSSCLHSCVMARWWSGCQIGSVFLLRRFVYRHIPWRQGKGWGSRWGGLSWPAFWLFLRLESISSMLFVIIDMKWVSVISATQQQSRYQNMLTLCRYPPSQVFWNPSTACNLGLSPLPVHSSGLETICMGMGWVLKGLLLALN